MSQFEKRAIDVTITIGKGPKGEEPGDPVTLSGLRVIVSTQVYATQTQGMLNALIYGVPLSMINQLTRVGMVNQQMKMNTISIAAGNRVEPKTVAYTGEIFEAYGDFGGAPEVPLVVQAQSGIVGAVRPVDAMSYKGATDAADIMRSIAKQMGYSFVNDGLSVTLADPYFSGTAMDQLKSCAQAAGASYLIENNTLTVWPKGEARPGDPILVSPETGMVGYPAFSRTGIVVETIFNPNFKLGRKVTLKSSLTPACGTWAIYAISHSLSSEMPNGPWFTQLALSTARNLSNG